MSSVLHGGPLTLVDLDQGRGEKRESGDQDGEQRGESGEVKTAGGFFADGEVHVIDVDVLHSYQGCGLAGHGSSIAAGVCACEVRVTVRGGCLNFQTLRMVT